MELLEIIHKPADLDEYSDILIALCRVASYTGAVSNLEPEKHRDLRFVRLDEIAELYPLSYPTSFIAKRSGARAVVGSPAQAQLPAANQEISLVV